MQKKGFDYGENTEFFPDVSDTASATECTGLMPTPPENREELESYRTLYSMETPPAPPRELPRRAPSRRDFKNGVYDGRPEEIVAASPEDR